MTTNQIYGIVNSTVSQSMGTEALTAIDERGLVAIGDAVLSSSTNTEAFLNTLVQRIGKVIFDSRTYTSKYSDMVMTEFEFGAIVQKIKVIMPEFIESEAYDLTDGTSVDQQIVSKPQVDQKLFVTRTPYSMMITIQRDTLKEAFLSEEGLGSFITSIYVQVENKIALRIDTMGRNCMANFIAMSEDEQTHYRLLTIYNEETGQSLTKADALQDIPFLKWVTAFINNISDYMEEYSTQYNIENQERFTPKEHQHLKVLTSFQRTLETQMQSGAYHDGYVKLNGFSKVNHFQSAQTPDSISVITSNGPTPVTDIIAVMYDSEALGIFNKEEAVETSPYNARGRYQNTFYHFKEMYFNDPSENFILFTLD